MSDAIFDAVEKSAQKMGGGAKPRWLQERKVPDFSSVEQGDDGPVLILLHGLFGAMSNWHDVQPLMAQYSKVIALEFPIIGGHRSEVRVKALALYTEYFIRSRGFKKVSLCGNSLGGHVAIRTTLAVPDLVDKLILSGSSGLYEHTVEALPVRPDERFITDQMNRVFYHQKFITEEAIAEILEILSKRMNHLNLIHAARSAKRDNLQSHLKDIEVPTLLLWGENDQVTTMTVAEIFHKEIPGSKLTTINECGHAPMIEYPEWFSEQVKSVLL